jgi:NAD(P)-dependent dehydrogenase (short-subunit alcohol dehydrogenase family)
MTRDMWDAVIDTNLGSCFNLCKLTFDDMRAKKFGRVVNVGSINGQAGQYGQVNYAAAKSGIHGFTKALAQEGARFGITVNAIAPATSTPKWCAPCRRTCCRKSSPASPWAAWATPRTSPAAWPS